MKKANKPRVSANKPRILVFDIETSPNLGYIWGKYEQNVIEFTKEWHMMSFSYKWLGDKKTHVIALPDFKRYKTHPEDDSSLVGALWALFDEADIIIAHNGDKFDIKKANAKFLEHGMTPPSPYKTIDTLKIARKYFALNSNKLDDLGMLLGVGRKVKHAGFELWKGCMGGNSSSWKKMKEYNKQDVVLLEKVYLKLRPWHSGHPSVSVYGDHTACPKCGSHSLQKNGVRVTQTTIYQQMICRSCGGYVRGTSKINEEKPLYV